MTPVEDPAIVFASAQILSRDGCSCLPSASQKLAKDLVTWQAMVGRHILIVAQYVDEHYINGTWAMIAWVAQSALKYRPRICELSALKDH
ncbi:hypothetical protein TNCV_4361121 [Trichonephila clavipes]|nr:hypothetical protein TNCV_4361121 [Trichonephila clavipes]